MKLLFDSSQNKTTIILTPKSAIRCFNVGSLKIFNSIIKQLYFWNITKIIADLKQPGGNLFEFIEQLGEGIFRIMKSKFHYNYPIFKFYREILRYYNLALYMAYIWLIYG